MRSIKLVGLVTAVAVATTAFIGASSATAAPEHPEIVLCELAELVCDHPFPSGIQLHLETLNANPPKLLSSLGTVECEHSLLIITLLNKLDKLIEGHLLSLVFFGNCHLGSTGCTVTVNALGGVSLTPGEKKLTAILKKINLEGRTTNTTYKCGSFLNCTYSAGAATEVELSSDAEGHLSLGTGAGAKLEGKGFLCPETATLDAVYHAVNLDAELTRTPGLWIEL